MVSLGIIKTGLLLEEVVQKLTESGAKIISAHNNQILFETETPDSTLFEEIKTQLILHHCSTTIELCGLTNEDIEKMTAQELQNKLKNVRDVALWWAAQKEDDRCWLDDVKVIKEILPHGCVHFTMPDDLTFINNCINFKKSRCPINPKLHEW